MNTEELEKSLRAEFESQMKNVLASAREDVADFQKNIEAQFEQHRSQVNDAFQALSARLESPVAFDQAFFESVTEHLRLARDEGALVTATAMDEAEKLQTPVTVQAPDKGYSKLRNAINEIKTRPTQAAILRCLVDAAADFAPRGAFFIVKNDYLVGWKVFGNVEVDENVVRSIHFPVESETVLSNAIVSLAASTGSAEGNDQNAQFLQPLAFGAPENMFAIPLAARGRGVAVLYADGGFENGAVNADALETLVSVAGLSVELLAGGTAPASDAPAAQHETEYKGEVGLAEEQKEPESETSTEYGVSESNFSDSEVQAVAEPEQEAPANEPGPVQQMSRPAPRTIDLPIPVSEEERDLHVKARRFARLLVSEIRLYNLPKVVEGRESGDIYEILKDAIDRSREMYDKRVQPDVASKFDYFHYELVHDLAEGEEEKLGAGYLSVKA
ncbi:MAG: hypothetical protein DMF62_09275 [Acidobacteria bacterium]|nr:MAG: hypothetical protein DMF62_09275 [Acidobacteriota bacterium]